MSQSHARILLAAGILSAASLAAAPPALAGEGAAGAVSPLAPPAPPQTGSSQGNPQRGGVGGFSGRFSAYERNAPDREDRTHINLGNEHVNAIFGGGGQGAGVGLGIQLTTADDIPGVELSAAAIVSTKLYRQFEGDAYFPSVGGEDTHADVRFRYRRRTKDPFFGIGPDVGPTFVSFEVPDAGPVFLEIPPPSSEDYATNYDLEQRQTSASLFHDFTDRLQAGVYAQYVSSSVYEGQNENEPVITTFFVPYGVPFFAFDPTNPGPLGVRFPVPGLFTGSKILSEGVYAEYDGRSKGDELPQGFYAYVRLANHDGLGEIEQSPGSFLFPFPLPPVLASRYPSNLNDYGWVNFTFDVRGYVPLFSDKTSLALRYFTELNDVKGGATIPFYDLARLGGGSTLRGFDTFRFHGRNSTLAQAEVRRRVYEFDTHDVEGTVDVVVFGDAGEVWGEPFDRNGARVGFLGLGPVVDEFDTDNLEADFGGGVHMNVANFTMRLEIAHSRETTKFVFGFNRAF